MTTFADWSRGIIDAAEQRGWAVISLDARLNTVILEEPQGSGGVTIRITGRTLNAALIEALPEPGAWLRDEPERFGA